METEGKMLNIAVAGLGRMVWLSTNVCHSQLIVPCNSHA